MTIYRLLAAALMRRRADQMRLAHRHPWQLTRDIASGRQRADHRAPLARPRLARAATISALALTLGAWSMVAPVPAIAASVSATASATVLAALSITKVSDLLFGSISTTGFDGTVTLAVNGSRTASNVDLAGGFTSSAQFNLTGEPLLVYAITLPATATMFLTTDNSQEMRVTNLADNRSGGIALSPTGTGGFAVVGTLNVGAFQAPGDYVGSFSVVVNYQ